MKKFKKLLAILLVASMIFTTNAVNVFAEGNKANQEEQLNEETVETNEESVGANLGEPEEEAEETTVGANEESVGAKLGEPEEDIDMDENLSEPEDDTRKGERLSEPALDEEEPEEEAEETTVGANEESVGAKLGEPEDEEPTESEIELELDKNKKDDQLYGDDLHYFILVGKQENTGNTITYIKDSTTDFNTWETDLKEILFDYGKYEFYVIDEADSLDEETVKGQWDETHARDGQYLLWLNNKYKDWIASPDNDIAIGLCSPVEEKNFYIVYFADDDGYSKENDGLSEIHFNKNAGAEAITQETLDKFGNLSAAELRGFYKIDATDLNSAKSNFSNEKEKTVDNTVASLRQAYTTWLNDGAAADVFYGALLNPYTYLFYYEGTVAKFEKFKCTDDVSAVTNTINLVKNNPPSGKKFKTWQYWVSDYIEFNPGEYYDFTDDGQLETYRNIATLVPEWYQEFETDEQLIFDFNRWKDMPNINIHFGAIYEDDIFMYWKVDGDDDNKTIHYYATDGDGRTPVEIGANGIVYTNLDNQEKEKIKNAVFEENIIASDVRSYFAGFSGLESITGLSKLDTSKATSFAKMFDDCSTIEKIDVSSLKTNSLTDTSYMFNDCRKVQTITFGNNFDTSKVTDMSYMFSTCNKLTTINFGNKFDTSNVTNMAGMFTAVGAETLDLAKFDTSKVTNMYGMFAQCLQLKTINVSDDFKVEQVNEGDYMFVDCSNLVGGKGTIYDDTSAPWGKTYAHIDEGDANPGFFTGAPTPKPTPTPTPSPSNSGSSSGGSDGGGSSDPTHGPMGDLTKNPQYANSLNNIAVNTTNDIPQSSLLNNQTLYIQLTAYPENTNVQKTNAADVYGHRGYGHWQRIPNTTTWYFYAGEFNNFTNNAGYLKDGWFNLGWDGQDKWYHFDANGVMQLGWYQEAGKTYFLQNDFNDNWYGKAVTGTQNIGGRVYNFDSTGALIN